MSTEDAPCPGFRAMRVVDARGWFLSFLLGAGLAGCCMAGCAAPSGSVMPCEAGHFGSGGSDCTPCAAGTYCPSGIGAPIDCVVGGTWDDDSDAATECVAVTTCSTEQYASAAPTATSDRVCTALTLCQPGQYVSVAATSTSDRVCTACASGSFSTSTNATVCEAWTVCPAGTYVSVAGTTTSDASCALCEEASYTSRPNQSACVPNGACAPGTVQTAAGTATMPPSCAACSAGEYCAGGAALALACDDGDGTWDHYADPSTACVARTDCLAGTYVSSEGDGTNDRSCAGCAAGEFSTSIDAPGCTAWTTCVAGQYVSTLGSDANDQICSPCAAGTYSSGDDEPSCSAWTTCGAGSLESTPGSSTTDRTCMPEWARQFGTAQPDESRSVAVDGSGNVLVAGVTPGSLPGQTSAGLNDAFVRKYASDGSLLWTKQFGSASHDVVRSARVDGAGNVVVAGYTNASLPGETSTGQNDAFVRTYASDGALLWSRQFGTASYEDAYALTVDSAANVLVVGYTEGSLPGATGSGDAFIRKYTSDGTLLSTRQFAVSGVVFAADLDGAGNVMVAGYTLGTLPGQTAAGANDAFVAKLAAP